MPKSWSNKDERQYAHVKDSERERGRSKDEAEEIAARTVNKQRTQEGRTVAATSRNGVSPKKKSPQKATPKKKAATSRSRKDASRPK